jgi:hypothetical protein
VGVGERLNVGALLTVEPALLPGTLPLMLVGGPASPEREAPANGRAAESREPQSRARLQVTTSIAFHFGTRQALLAV